MTDKRYQRRYVLLNSEEPTQLTWRNQCLLWFIQITLVMTVAAVQSVRELKSLFDETDTHHKWTPSPTPLDKASHNTGATNAGLSKRCSGSSAFSFTVIVNNNRNNERWKCASESLTVMRMNTERNREGDRSSNLYWSNKNLHHYRNYLCT